MKIMMKIIPILLILLPSVLLAQNIDSLGLNDNGLLNSEEALYLNKSVGNQLGTFDFTNKVVVFTEGNYAKIIYKSDYFKRLVIPYLERNTDMINTLVVLTDNEKTKSGGYDAIIVAWSKIGLTNNRKKAIIKKMNKRKYNNK